MNTQRPTEALPKSRILGPDGKRCPWGPIVAVHEIGDMHIVEYLRDMSNTHAQDYSDHGVPQFQGWINGRCNSMSYRTLDSAIVGTIAVKRDGVNTRAGDMFDRMTLPWNVQH